MNLPSSAGIFSASGVAEAKQVWGQLSPEGVTEHARLRWPGGVAKSAARRLLIRAALDLETGCANCAAVWTNGYAKCYVKTDNALGHRVAWHLFIGDPGPLWVLHKCDNRRCINPAHLFLGTRQDNMDDMVRKGRSNTPRGERSPFAKITRADALAIRAAYKPRVSGRTNPNGFRVLAERFGISITQTRAIVHKHNWAWL